jgi:hypothetical protein
VKLTCEFSEAHVKALEKVIDGLDYETIEAIAKSPQEGYDIIFCLQSLRDAIKVAQNPPSAPSKSDVARFSSAPSGRKLYDFSRPLDANGAQNVVGDLLHRLTQPFHVHDDIASRHIVARGVVDQPLHRIG